MKIHDYLKELLNIKYPLLGLVLLTGVLTPHLTSAEDDMANIGNFLIDRNEVSISKFAKFVTEDKFVTKAEREGGGLVYSSGWEQKIGWTWHTPYGRHLAQLNEPAVHITFDEAKAYCEWAKKRLPTDSEWVEAAYTEWRHSPPRPFKRGRKYFYPTGDSPLGANVWEWVDIEEDGIKGTRGGSWWYGSTQMRSDFIATKPRNMAAVYIEFRCVRDINF
jgi:sulfatase modifying factor 1